MAKPTNHFKSSNVINTFQKSTDPVKAYGIYNNTEMTHSSDMVKKTLINTNKKFSSHKNIGYIMTETSSNGASTNSSNNCFSHNRPLTKKHSNTRITIDLNDSVAS